MLDKLIVLSSAAILSLATISSASASSDTVEVEQTKKSQMPKKIKDRRHPDYVRCRSEPVIGSLARKRRVCMTNREWTIHIREGNKRTGQFMSDIQGGMKVDPE